MARIRSIKPGFFHNEILAECEPLARILFMGLWGIANFEGVLEDRPKRIKTQVLPYDDCDIDRLLRQLIQHGFILRKAFDGKTYLYLPTFQLHQNPHKKERDAKNVLPPASSFQESLGAPSEIPSQGSMEPRTAPAIVEPNEPFLEIERTIYEEEFDAFWNKYPRKTGR